MLTVVGLVVIVASNWIPVCGLCAVRHNRVHAPSSHQVWGGVPGR